MNRFRQPENGPAYVWPSAQTPRSHRSPAGPPYAAAVQHWQPGERLSVASAFDAATRGAHWAGFADNAGTIRAGAAASLAIWDIEDTELDGPAPLPRLDGDELPTCVATISAGQTHLPDQSRFGWVGSVRVSAPCVSDAPACGRDVNHSTDAHAAPRCGTARRCRYRTELAALWVCGR